ncbi:MAG: pyridoxal-dependent decarboxylase, partial [Arenimonas sp.]|nr:pyridoxal-dependent decarboxylase [Arenimonas sp.]
FAARLDGRLQCRIPFEPDSNLICLALNPAGNRDVATMNRFVRALHGSLSYDAAQPLQSREFFGSMTTLRPEILGRGETLRVLASLDLDPATLDAGGEDDDRVVILRHTLMNPFLLDTGNGISYLEMYFDYLERRATALMAEAA